MLDNLYQAEEVPLFFFLRVFIMNGCWIMWNASFALINIINVIFFFSLLIWHIIGDMSVYWRNVYYIDWFSNSESALHPWDSSIVIMHNSFYIFLFKKYLFIWLCQVFSYITQDLQSLLWHVGSSAVACGM